MTNCSTNKIKTQTFKDDLAFLNKHTKVILLKDDSEHAYVIVAPQYQGRVLTSTAGGLDGKSFGWINRKVIASGKPTPHMNVFGGEDRFWLGPEGGQFSIYFKAGSTFELKHWQVPAPIDWGGWKVTNQNQHEVTLSKDITIENYSRTQFSLRVDRTIRLLNHEDIIQKIGFDIGKDIQSVGYESINTITNTGDHPWTKDTGLLSIWILGMFNPSARTTVVMPIQKATDDGPDKLVNDAYFGKVPEDRLRVTDNAIYFKGDGQYRSKIGIRQGIAKNTIGSYDGQNQVLTIVQYSLPSEPMDYVNSMWEIQSEPYKGDVVNSYNDGPPELGKPPLGPFYELETSSPAVELTPGEQVNHVHRTIHLHGNVKQLDPIARSAFGTEVSHIDKVF